MDNNKVNSSRRQSFRPGTRRLVQLYSALLYNAHLRGFISGEIYRGSTKALCVPGFNCYSCPGATYACPLGAIQNALASTGHRAGWYVLGIIMLYGVILGRTVCGWICPLGLIQELLHRIPTPKIPKSQITRALSWLKYVILIVFVVAVTLWYGIVHDLPLPAFCKYICPAGTFEGAMGLLPANPSFFDMLGILFTRKFVIMLVIGMACVFCYRSFCRFICPLGAIYGLFNRFNIIGVKVDAERCNHCGACVSSCGMDIRRVGDHECINCGKCMEVCRQNAISIKAGKLTLKAPEGGSSQGSVNSPDSSSSGSGVKTGRIVWGIALAVLCFALLWFNILDPTVKKAAASAPVPDSGNVQTAALQTEKTVNTDIQTEEAYIAGTQTEEADIATARTGTIESEASQTESYDDQTEAGEPVLPEHETEQEETELNQTRHENGQEETEPNDTAETSYESSAPIGYEVGQQLEDFTVQCFDGSTFHLADTRGKVTFINLWATYCTPCVQELPYFNDLYNKYKDDVAVLAVHSSLAPKDDPAEFISDEGYDIQFTTDSKDDTVFKIVNGGFTLPQTIVLNRRGEVIYNKAISMTPEMLESLYQEGS